MLAKLLVMSIGSEPVTVARFCEHLERQFCLIQKYQSSHHCELHV